VRILSPSDGAIEVPPRNELGESGRSLLAITILDPFVESCSEGLWRADTVNGMTLILPISVAIIDTS